MDETYQINNLLLTKMKDLEKIVNNLRCEILIIAENYKHRTRTISIIFTIFGVIIGIVSDRLLK